MQRYFIKLSYVGTNYHGWQQQANTPDTIQEIINVRYSSILGEKINVLGCGRTDTGVHAREFYAHFELEKTDLMAEYDLWLYKFNVVLPHDIAVHKIIPVALNFNARFSARARTYRYYLHHKKDAFLLNRSYYCPGLLNVNEMNRAAGALVKYKDFTSFSRTRTQVENYLCDIMQAEWQVIDNGLVFTIKANRFLRNMVRAIVGTMVDIGKGKLSVEEFCTIIEQKDRKAAGFSAPACGLYLEKVEYKDGMIAE